MISLLPPAFYFIFSALLIPFLPKRIRQVFLYFTALICLVSYS
eukprot:COSAG05_NODE_154_length_15733_cov_2.293015_17_plen_43_part_00